MLPPSDHLLRTFAAIRPGSKVLVSERERGRHARPLALLGFEVEAIDERLADAGHYEEATFGWVVAYDVFPVDGSSADLIATLFEARRVLKPGGWIYLAARIEGNALEAKAAWRQILQEANLALSEDIVLIEEEEQLLVRGIYRRVEADTPG